VTLGLSRRCSIHRVRNGGAKSSNPTDRAGVEDRRRNIITAGALTPCASLFPPGRHLRQLSPASAGLSFSWVPTLFRLAVRAMLRRACLAKRRSISKSLTSRIGKSSRRLKGVLQKQTSSARASKLIQRRRHSASKSALRTSNGQARHVSDRESGHTIGDREGPQRVGCDPSLAVPLCRSLPYKSRCRGEGSRDGIRVPRELRRPRNRNGEFFRIRMNARVYRDFILVLHEPRFGGAFLRNVVGPLRVRPACDMSTSYLMVRLAPKIPVLSR
jgi:AraC-like DNA-binding protein